MPNLTTILGTFAAAMFAAAASFGWLWIDNEKALAVSQSFQEALVRTAKADRDAAAVQIGLQNAALADLRTQAKATQVAYETAMAEARQRASAATTAAATIMGRKPATTDLCAEAMALTREQMKGRK